VSLLENKTRIALSLLLTSVDGESVRAYFVSNLLGKKTEIDM